MKSKIKAGNWIEFGYERVWHVKAPNDITYTKNIMCVINGECVDENHKKIKGAIAKYHKDSIFGMLLEKIIKKYGNSERKGKFECGGGSWQYRFPYLRKIPKAELALIL